jgi:hypothetical protein
VQRAGDGGSVVQQQLQISATDNVRRVRRFESWVVRPAGEADPADQAIVIEGWALGEVPRSALFAHPATWAYCSAAIHMCQYMPSLTASLQCWRSDGV